jgi:hypothetical protein
MTERPTTGDRDQENGHARVSTEDQQVDLQLDAEGTSMNDVANIFGGHVSTIYRRFDTSIV